MTQLVFGDVHFPFHDRKALIGLLAQIVVAKPDRIDCNGDLLDCTALSTKFPDLPTDKRVWTPDHELKLARNFLELLKEMCPNAQFCYHEGNHEARFPRWLNSRGREVRSMVRSVPTELGLAGHDIRWSPYGALERVGGIAVTHGSVIRKGSGSSGRAQLEQYGTSLIINHTHRGGAYYVTDSGGVRVAYENFCLCTMKPHYILGVPNWQQGWSVVHHHDKEHYSVEQVVWNAKARGFHYRGQWVDGTASGPAKRWASRIPQSCRWD